jgi:ABC-type polysaccharide/polyol phosphate transport system ATPase subunit
MPVAIRAEHLSKRFYLRHNRAWSVKERFLGLFHRDRREQAEEFWALRDVSLEIERGEAVGIIGSNGSGKSTFLKLVAGIHRPTAGRVRLAAGTRIGSMIELGLGFHPELTGRENVLLSASVHGLSRDRIDGIFAPVVAYSGLEQFIDEPLKNYSSGMHMRLGFAIAVHLDPDLMLLDEIFAVGDADFQQRCIRTIRDFQEQQKTIVFVSHSEAAVKTVCGRACLLDHGRLHYEGPVSEVFAAYDALRTGAAASSAAALDVALERRTASDALDLEVLRAAGLRPGSRVLEIGCGAIERSVPLIRFLDPGCYTGVDADEVSIADAGDRLLPAAGLDRNRVRLIATPQFVPDGPEAFDFVIARQVLQRLSLNAIARCLVSVLQRLEPDGQFLANLWEQPAGPELAPAVRPGNIVTSLDVTPYQYSLEMLNGVAAVLGSGVSVITRRAEPGAAVVVFRPLAGARPRDAGIQLQTAMNQTSRE